MEESAARKIITVAAISFQAREYEILNCKFQCAKCSRSYVSTQFIRGSGYRWPLPAVPDELVTYRNSLGYYKLSCRIDCEVASPSESAS